MKPDRTLVVASLLVVLLLTFHLADDILLGFEKGGLSNVSAFPILAVWLYATLALGGRRSGLIVILLGALLAAAVPVIHMSGRGLAAQAARTGGGFRFVWTAVALGAVAPLVAALAARALWRRGGDAGVTRG